MKTHVLERTSPKGEKFVGRCILCGRTHLVLADAWEPCPNPDATSSDEALVCAVEGRTR